MSVTNNWWDVFLLFLIPVGGGIPAGVVLAKARAVEWPVMMVLYFVSDVVLACVFEPVTWFMVWLGKRSAFVAQMGATFKATMDRSVSRFRKNPSALTLVMISFGVDPMTGRAAALASGHGFLTGWAVAIAGDMIFFALIMVSTLWLNNILGDGTWAAVIVMVLMLMFPPVLRRLKALI